MSKKIFGVLALLLVASLLLVVCGPSANTNQSASDSLASDNAGDDADEDPGNDIEETDDSDDTSPPDIESPRHGSWADTVILIEEPSAEAAVSRLADGSIDLYSASISDLSVLQAVEVDPNLTYSQSVGSHNELLFNPSGPVFNNGGFNPFASPGMREAMNMLVNRDYILQKFLGGLGYTKYLPITSVFPDYARIADVANLIEAQYTYAPEKAKAQMTEVLFEMGAEKNEGIWYYKGEQIKLTMVIRTEDERRGYGDYIADLLNDFGFYVDRQYKNSAIASRIISQSDPADGLWHMYTGGWTATAINRDAASNFEFFYTPLGLPGYPPWDSMTPSEEFQELATALSNNQFTSMEERSAMLAEAAPLAMQDSVRIWLYDSTSFTPRRADVEVTADLAGAVAGTTLWTYTLKRAGEEGGTFTVGMPSMLQNPWNSIAGSIWIYDKSIISGISDWAVIPDPYTGLELPQRLASAEVTIKTGLPVGVTYDWVSLDFADSIEVPAEAWVDWDAVSQTFITVGEKFPEGLTAKSKVVCNYEDTLYEDSIWHDGSNFSIADVVMYMIMHFDFAKEDSAIYDQVQVASTESWMESDFRGWNIASVEPLVVEYYSDSFALDAENNVTNAKCGWPEYDQGQSAWHSLSLGIMAEAAEQLAFTPAKSQRLDVEWTNYVGGPSLKILAIYLDKGISNSYIPYEPTLGMFVTTEEAAARYANLERFYTDYGHFWVGNGPMFMEAVDRIESTVILQNFADFPDLSSKWSGYSVPKLAEVQIDGPRILAAGDPGVFDVFVTFDGADYPLSEIENVKYLLFDATGAMVELGSAEAVSDGHYQIVLSGNQTVLVSGASRLEVIVVPIVVSIPTLEAFEFVVE
ncbi:MAG: ABC transporter substrate-binding protein [Chloroflexota bacterium]